MDQNLKIRTGNLIVGIFHNAYTAWIILAISLTFTASAFLIATKYAENQAHDRFSYRASEILHAIESRMQVYESVLQGGVGLFNASKSVERQEWKSYVDSLQIDTHWPGIQGLGFAIPIQHQDLQAHIQNIRSQGFPDYSIKPANPRANYTSIIMLEPFDWRNKRAFGFDMWSNQTRREAMKRARDTGKPSMSGIITLVQETKENVQKGFLSYLPVYQKGYDLSSTSERQSAFQGWVYAAFRANDLMAGILGSTDTDLHFEIVDSSNESKQSLFYDSNPQYTESKGHDFAMTKSLDWQGRTWAITFHAPKGAIAGSNSAGPTYIAIAAVIVDLLLFYVIYSISFLRNRAQAIASEMTKALSTKTDDLKKTKIELQKRLVDLESTQGKLVESSNLASLGEMAGGIAHEINNPLMIISGYMEKLLMQAEHGDITKEELTKTAEATKTTAFRIKGIVQGLKNFSRDSHDEPTRVCEFGELIDETLNLCREKFKNCGIELEVTGNRQALILCRRLQVSQVLINLLNNARHAVDGSEKKVVQIHCRNDRGQVEISVTDSGVGIPEEFANKIFLPFFTTKEVGKGTGLGLSISKGLIQNQNGKLELEILPVGTKFTITLPIAESREAAA